jgi:hypothetical protein
MFTSLGKEQFFISIQFTKESFFLFSLNSLWSIFIFKLIIFELGLSELVFFSKIPVADIELLA